MEVIDKHSYQQRIDHIVEMMREMSLQTDPQTMIQVYSRGMRQLMHIDRLVAISRRDVEAPQFKVTRNTDWTESINPWKSPELLPVITGGFVADILYAEKPIVIADLNVDPSDPSAAFFAGMKSLMAVPSFEGGKSLNMVLLMRKEANAFTIEKLAEQVLTTNLFGRATNTLVMSQRVNEAYDAVDRELQVVADIQRSLLPEVLPTIPTLQMSVHYQTSKRAGGDYYDFFPLPGANGEPALSERGRWGILIADVSGHGTPAAVLMAVTHSIAHTCTQEPASPAQLLRFVNDHLCARYTNSNGTFVTAFYGIYDPTRRELRYASAGHCPPRLRRAGQPVASLEAASYLPLGIDPGEPYGEGLQIFQPGDVLVLYTDGITEARAANRELLGIPRLDGAIEACDGSPADYVKAILADVNTFEAGQPAVDDRTLLVARVT